MKKIYKKYLGGFSLIEALIVVALIALTAGLIILSINPAEQIARTRNTQRKSDVNLILNAIGQRLADNKGIWNSNCSSVSTTLAVTSTNVGTNSGLVNLEPCLVPIYLQSMVYDPIGGNASDTKYQIIQNATSGVITVSAPDAELGETINVTR